MLADMNLNVYYQFIKNLPGHRYDHLPLNHYIGTEDWNIDSIVELALQ
jgi:hypothetical protein